jgi:hypothetical protein
MDNDLTVAECKAEKELLELEIKAMLQRFSDKYNVRCYTLSIVDGGMLFGARIPAIQRVELTVHV